MSSERLAPSVVERIETSLSIAGDGDIHRSSKRLLPAFARGFGEASDSARNDKGKDKTQPLFAVLDVYRDISSRGAAINMAIDEVLLESVEKPSIRFYRWDHPALSFGYFGKLKEVSGYIGQRDMVRRWTGGGIVLHGEDLTYALVIPARHPAFAESSMCIYEKVHRALCEAFVATGTCAELAPAGAVCDRREQTDSAVADRRYSKDACFANPVRADVMIKGRKVAGAAQRRTRSGLLQQGSIQQIDLAEDFEMRFARELSLNCNRRAIENEVSDRAHEIGDRKYCSEVWLHKR